MSTFAFWTPGPYELIIVAVVLILLFGPKKLPQLAHGIGSSFVEFKNGLRSGTKEIKDAGDEATGAIRDIQDKMKA